MEKLQAAIESARRRRAAQAVEAAPAGLPPTVQADAPAGPAIVAPVETGNDRRGSAELEARWAALDPVMLQQGRLTQSRILSLNASASSAPFDVLRTKILYQMQQKGWRRLAITSPLPRCGKTTTACNLALGLCRQPELRSVLFDFDLRSPSVASVLGIAEPQPIISLLNGQRSFAQHAHRLSSNLALALSGRAEPDPTRVLMSDSTQSMLARVQDEYQPDVMIFDLPSILIGDDARAFLQQVDCALIIARADQTRYGEFDSCEREVGEYTNVLGVVLNGYRHGEGIEAPDSPS